MELWSNPACFLQIEAIVKGAQTSASGPLYREREKHVTKHMLGMLFVIEEARKIVPAFGIKVWGSTWTQDDGLSSRAVAPSFAATR